MTSTELLTRADELRHGRTPFVLATVVRAQRPSSARPGDSALVLPDGTVEGFVGGTCAESTVQLQGLRLLQTGESVLLRITPGGRDTGAEGEGLVTVANPCPSGGTLDIFLEAHLPPVLVHVYGHAPIARALLDVGRALGHDARPAEPGAPMPSDLDVVVIASHGRDEEAVLTEAVRAGVPYVGLVAGPKRGAAVLAALGLGAQERARVHTPAGLDIGARTPPEIALSVYAEVIALRPRPAARRTPDATSAAGPVAAAADPVCGMTIAVTPGAVSLTEETGGTVYFCGPGCRHAYADDPGRYAHAGRP
ncbi:XdhC family protein [Streptomyces sp. NPDC026673]|uniref:XdhC family protein n=1 Tax=Streptomyces sp. NPDC026673 TaxID=3155724 RepID=UPI0033CA7C10